MIIKNVKIYTEDKKFEKGTLYVEGGRFVSPSDCISKDEVIDGKGAYALPGFIDLHFHGCMGADFCDGTKEAIQKIAKYEVSVGVTTIAPATMTLPVEELKKILHTAAVYDREQGKNEVAELVGINMEGPFISKAKKGAQDERNILPCNIEICKRFLEESNGLVKFVGIAPEESENYREFIQEMKDKVHISLAHTNADYETANAAFQAGANHAVHLYNAMSPYTHRAPGVVGAVADNKHVWTELICDGVHIHPAAVRTTFHMLGEDRIVFISDSMRATGMKDGVYTLGGLDVEVHGNRATLISDGALAGSVTNLADCVRTAVREMRIPLETAVACATINPARCLEIQDEYGSVREGKVADLVLWDQELNLKAVIKKGRLVI